MNRAEIPDALLKARRGDVDRIPSAVLAKMTRADLVNRLLAAGEYRHRAHAPRLDADLYRLRIGQASEVLTTSDPKRAAELVKGAGVGVTVGAGRPTRPVQAPPVMNSVRKALGLPPRSAMRPTSASVSYAASEVAWQRSPAARAMAKAAQYEQRAAVVTDPQLRKGYLELAEGERTGAW